jgi:hypothetical protein
MAEQHIVGVVLGASSLLVGYLINKAAQMRQEELSYLQHVPQFPNFRSLREHLRDSPNQKADVLIEGVVEKLNDNALISEKTGLEGAAKLVTTTTYTKVYQESSTDSESNTAKWRDMSNTIENVNISVPFKLSDGQGNSVNVSTVHRAGGFRQVLQRVWQEKIGPDSRHMGDYLTNITLREIPNGYLTREFLLVFGTSIGAYGSASLQKSQSGFFASEEVTFAPVEVGTSIRALISRNELIVNSMKFVSLVLLLGGGSIMLITFLPLLFRLISGENGRGEERREPLGFDNDRT